MTPERFRRIRRILAHRQTDLTVLMEQVNKQHNFSAILRTCDAVGVHTVHAVPPERSAFRVHHYTAGGSGRWVGVEVHETTAVAVAALKGQGFSIVAAHPSPDAIPLTSIDFTAPVAVMVGAELDGVSEEGLESADQILEVPMVGMVGSLNVSVATAVILYEAVRQRASSASYQPRRLPESVQDRLAVEWSYPRVTELCRKNGLPYPELDENGYIVGP